MNYPKIILLVLCGMMFFSYGVLYAEEGTVWQTKTFSEEELRYLGEDRAIEVSDPLEPLNRLFFTFNDRLYFWLLRPISKGYSFVFPEPLRVCFLRAYENVKMPIRAINCLLQLKFHGFIKEMGRFLINSTVGILGFGDPAKEVFGLSPQDEDLGQTFGSYGIGAGFYIVWPILGPSTLRDTVGKAGDSLLNPISHLESKDMLYVRATESINQVSLEGMKYEDLKGSSLDPYVSMRDAYCQQRETKIKE